ncbi:MAG: LamG-like jellyroll fold domain-containing protein, partial [Verrucomicrobiota bacterium]
AGDYDSAGGLMTANGDPLISGSGTLTVTSSDGDCSPPADSCLVGLWRFEGGYTDSSLRGNDGSPINGVTLAAGQAGFGQAASFNGANTHILVPHDASLDITTEMTIAAWVRIDGNAWEGIVAKNPSNGSGANQAGNYELRVENGSRNMVFLYQRGNPNDTAAVNGGGATQVPVTPAWAHLAVTMDGASVNYYLNGALVSTVGAPAGFGAINTNPLYIGSRADLFTDCHCLLDDVAIFKKVLSAGEIATVMNGDFAAFINEDCEEICEDVVAGVTIEDVSSELSGFGGRLAVDTINGSGFNPGTGVHDVNAGNMWLTDGPFEPGEGNDIIPSHITYDLENNYDLNSLTVWNYNEAAAGNTDRGAQDVTISVADSVGGAFTSLGNFTFNQAPGSASAFGQVIDLSSFPAADNTRLIRLDILSNYGDADGVSGLSEIQFTGLCEPVAGPCEDVTPTVVSINFTRT